MSTHLQSKAAETRHPPSPDAVRVDVQSMALSGLFVIACFAALVAAREFFIPLAFTLMLYFLLMPVVRALKRAHIPESVAAAILVVLIVGLLAVAVYALSWPAADWLEKAPQSLARVRARLDRMLGPLAPMAAASLGGGSAGAPVTQDLGAQVLARVQRFLDSLAVVAALLYFLLAAGDSFLRAFVRLLPNLRDKVRAVAIAREMESNISRYLVAFTINNLILGAVTAVAMALLGMPYTRQGDPRGLGHAVLCAARHVGDEAFAVLLGDDLIDPRDPLLSRMLEVQQAHGGAVVALMEVPSETIHLYGCAAAEPTGEDDVVLVRDLVEKPSAAEAPSNLAIIGRYVLPSRIFDVLRETAPGKGGEIQLTDALRTLAASSEEEPVHGVVFRGRRYDTGDRLDYLKTVVRLAADREDLGPEFRAWLQEFVTEKRWDGE